MNQRGLIYWCNLEPVRGHEQGSVRPVVVVSADFYNATKSPLRAIVPLTKALPKSAVHVRLEPSETGLVLPSTVLVDHARFVDQSRLQGDPIGRLEPMALEKLDRYLSRVFGLLK